MDQPTVDGGEQMNRKMRGTVAVFIIAVAIIVAGVVNQYLASNVGAEPETTEQETTTPTDGSDVTESETTTPTTAGPETTEQETTTPTDLTRFRVIVNGVQELDVLVPVTSSMA